MFGSLGYWASSKGMVSMPDLFGLTEAQASTALSNVVLSYTKIANTLTSNSSVVGKVATQSSAAGSLVNYESIIQISLYELICVPVFVRGPLISSTPCTDTLPRRDTYRWESTNCGTYSFEDRTENVGVACPPPPPPSTFPPVWTDQSISTSLTYNVSYSDSVSATNSPSYLIVEPVPGPYLPISGIGINSSTGQLSGTPSSPNQPFRFRIMAYNSDGTIFSPNFEGTVAPGCFALPNTTTTENVDGPLDANDCFTRRIFDVTYNGCGSEISRVLRSTTLICV
jgi:hypothetical protein